MEQITIYLDLMDMIDNSLKEFKEKFMTLRKTELKSLEKRKEKLEAKIENSKK